MKKKTVKKPKRRTASRMPTGKGIIRPILWYIKNNFYQFIVILIVAGIIISFLKADIKCKRKGIEIEKPPLEIEKMVPYGSQRRK